MEQNSKEYEREAQDESSRVLGYNHAGQIKAAAERLGGAYAKAARAAAVAKFAGDTSWKSAEATARRRAMRKFLEVLYK